MKQWLCISDNFNCGLICFSIFLYGFSEIKFLNDEELGLVPDVLEEKTVKPFAVLVSVWSGFFLCWAAIY